MIDDFAEPFIEVPPAKIVHYLLNIDHPKGGPKAAFFLGFGFRLDEPDVMAQALIDHLLDHVSDGQMRAVDRRERFVVEGEINTPDGRNPRIRSVWQLQARTVWCLITAVPLTR